MPAALTSGRWFTLTVAHQHANLKAFGRPTIPKFSGGSARVQRGEWAGPGRYLLLSYTQRCPRNCCDDAVFEVLSAADVAALAREAIRKHADLLRTARTPIAPATDGPNLGA
jgi:hypothetical protein